MKKKTIINMNKIMLLIAILSLAFVKAELLNINKERFIKIDNK